MGRSGGIEGGAGAASDGALGKHEAEATHTNQHGSISVFKQLVFHIIMCQPSLEE